MEVALGEIITTTYVSEAVGNVEDEPAEVTVDEIKMEVEDHLAREYVEGFVLDHLDPNDVKREVSIIFSKIIKT